MARTLNLTITGEQKIHCAGCEERTGNALLRLRGIRDVQASADTQQVVVTFDRDTVSADQVRAKLEQLGYRVSAEGRARHEHAGSGQRA